MVFLIALIIVLGHVTGRQEQWSRSDALYYAFITATTVDFGDFHPNTRAGKLTAIDFAFSGLLHTGIIVALGVKAASVSFQSLYGLPATFGVVK